VFSTRTPSGYNLFDHVGGRRKVGPLYCILLGSGLAFALGLGGFCVEWGVFK
jgi:hypothetical protein